MKKLLSVLLVLALAMSLAVCAFAAKENEPPAQPGASRFQDFVPAQAETQSLIFELPVVTGITAEWDGNTEGLFDRWYGPYFGPSNVAVTVSFEEGEPQALTSWNGSYSGDTYLFWDVFYDYDDVTGIVTFYYQDTNFRQAYRDSLGEDGEWIWEDLKATLPQASFAVPANPWEEQLKSQPKTELKLGESKKAALADKEMKVFSFTPEKSGLYYFYSCNRGSTDPYAQLYDADFNYVTHNDDLFDLDFGIIMELQAGETYYLAVHNLRGDAGEFDVGVRDDVRKYSVDNVIRLLFEFFTGGFFRGIYYPVNNDICFIPGSPTMWELIKTNLTFNDIRFAFIQSLIDWLYSIR